MCGSYACVCVRMRACVCPLCRLCHLALCCLWQIIERAGVEECFADHGVHLFLYNLSIRSDATAPNRILAADLLQVCVCVCLIVCVSICLFVCVCVCSCRCDAFSSTPCRWLVF